MAGFFRRIRRVGHMLRVVHQQKLLAVFAHYLPKRYQWWVRWLYPAVTDRAQRLRLSLEALGPIFIKLGQMVSTRVDLIPPDIAQEFSKLQDQVPPFAYNDVEYIIEKAFGKKIHEVFDNFNVKPVASASMAQVHFAQLKTGKPVAVKVLRPNMQNVIETDLILMRDMAKLLVRLFKDARRLKLSETIQELDKHLHHELDLMREAANASQLKRNMQKHENTRRLIHVPDIYFDHCRTNVLTMERVEGVMISKINQLKEHNIDLKKLASDGVELFFSQVFRDGFFHADMHPGNIFVSIAPGSKGRYIALDFGIMGTLSSFDKHYLAQNFLAFFERDYHQVAQLHVESQWVPPNTNIEDLEGAVRTCCEPYFDKPLKEISLGLVLMRLFQTSREFNVEIQPQLTLLQKTLLNIEGLGRQLDPDLDLWKTAKPVLQKWMSEQVGYQNLLQQIKQEGRHWTKIMPQLPRLLHAYLQAPAAAKLPEPKNFDKQLQRQNALLQCILFVLGVIVGMMLR